MTLALIDKQDNFEIVRDQIASILAVETANQQQLADLAGKDPSLWKLRIFVERNLPWGEFQALIVADESPLVNIWFDNTNYDKAGSNTNKRQKSVTTYNIDCIGFGIAADDVGGGFTPGDFAASENTQRAIRLVRNILMASENRYLQLRGVVGDVWPQSITVFPPEIDNTQRPSITAQRIIGARIALMVTFDEFSPQFQGDALEVIGVTAKREGTNEIYYEAEYSP